MYNIRRSKLRYGKNVNKAVYHVSSNSFNEYLFPPIDFLKPVTFPTEQRNTICHEIQEIAQTLIDTLQSFGIDVTLTNITHGPSITRYELTFNQPMRSHKIIRLTNDIKLRLAANYVHIELSAPNIINVDVSNKEIQNILLYQLLESHEFLSKKSPTAFPVGKDHIGKTIIADIANLEHLLIAGHTGSGKSIWLNTVIISLLYKARPSEVKFIMIDPRGIELSRYNGIPHLLLPTIHDPRKAVIALNWAINEMEERYRKFHQYKVTNITEYNSLICEIEDFSKIELLKMLPKIIIIIDDFIDLIATEKLEIENALKKLTQSAAKTGIHLIIVAQRPSVDVISESIKANIPSRISFSVVNQFESKIILGTSGAEKLHRKGEMLYQPYVLNSPIYVQGAFISDDEIKTVVNFLLCQTGNIIASADLLDKKPTLNDQDELFEAAGRFIIEQGRVSIGNLQRHLKIGFNRSARIVDQLYLANVVGADIGTKPQEILMSLNDFEKYLKAQNTKKRD